MKKLNVIEMNMITNGKKKTKMHYP